MVTDTPMAGPQWRIALLGEPGAQQAPSTLVHVVGDSVRLGPVSRQRPSPAPASAAQHALERVLTHPTGFGHA